MREFQSQLAHQMLMGRQSYFWKEHWHTTSSMHKSVEACTHARTRFDRSASKKVVRLQPACNHTLLSKVFKLAWSSRESEISHGPLAANEQGRHLRLPRHRRVCRLCRTEALGDERHMHHAGPALADLREGFSLLVPHCS